METFPRNWPFVQGIHRSPVNSPHKGQWHGAMIFTFICAWINCWVNNRNGGDLRRHRAHYDVTVIVRRAGLMRSQQDSERWWSVPFTCAWLYMRVFFILFDLCLFITIFNFILNYVLIVTFWILTYYKIWTMLIIYCFIWNYWFFFIL